MRIDGAGEVQSSWNGFAGAPVAVAAGDDDAYVVLAGVRDPAVSDEPVLGACHIVAMDANAEVRWTTTWDRMDEQSRCPSALALVDGTLVARSGPALVGFSATDGVQAWEQTGLPWSPRNALAVVGSDVWMVGVRVGSDDAWPVAMRIRADDGELAEIALADPEWGLGAFTVGPQEIVMLQDGGNPLRPDVRLAAFGHDGTTRWVEPLVTALDPAAGSRTYAGVVHLDGRYWIAGGEEQPGTVDIAQPSVHRMWLQRHAAGGKREATLLREFAEHPGDTADRGECPSDVQRPSIVGSAIDRMTVDGDGRLLVAGRQGCRDAFAFAFEVPR